MYFQIPDPPLDFEFPTERTRKIKSPRPIDSSEEETSPDTSSCDDETDGGKNDKKKRIIYTVLRFITVSIFSNWAACSKCIKVV